MKVFVKMFSSAALLVAVISCVKEGWRYDGPEQEIAINPVMTVLTKVLAEPVTGVTYPAGETFGVFASYSATASGQEWTAGGSAYIEDKEFVNKGGSFGSSQPSYWPLSGSLVFAGYSPYRYVDGSKVGNVSFDSSNKVLTINGYTTDFKSDLMYFLPQLTNGNFVGLSDKASDVSVNFRHALSLVSIEVALQNSDDDYIKLKKVTLKNVKTRGDFEVDAETPDAGVWTNQQSPSDKIFFESATGQGLVTPQTMWGLVIPDNAVSIEVVYETIFHDMSTGQDVAKEKTASVDPAEVGVEDWEMGKKYTYELLIGSSKIHVNPSTSFITVQKDIEL